MNLDPKTTLLMIAGTVVVAAVAGFVWHLLWDRIERRYPRPRPCPFHGRGGCVHGPAVVKCARCGGRGSVRYFGAGGIDHAPCPDCGGTDA